jgi:hypothetical protein
MTTCTALLCAVWLQAQDLHIKKNISVGGNFASTTETSIKGARERTVSQGSGGSTVTLRQCDLKRTVTLNEQAQTYYVVGDPQDENAARAAALATGAAVPESSGGKITVTTTVTDTGERKTMYGYQARHLKAKVSQESSADACMKVNQSFEIDGWFADISKEQSACAQIAPPIQQSGGCHDTVISHRSGSGKLGYPLVENITMPSPDGSKMTVTIQTSELSKQDLSADLFDVPAGYRQVNSLAELHGMPQMQQPAAGQQQAAGSQFQGQGFQPPMNQGNIAAAQMAAQQGAWAQAQQMGMMAQGARMPGMPNQQFAGAAVATPQALGPKAPGRIRIGVAPPDAQVGQGNNAGADYSTPIRNAEIALMSGPAVEIAPLDSRIAMQLQSEAQQKQCDYILYSAVSVKHNSGGGFGKFMKMAGPVASMTPMGMATKGMGGAMAAQVASQAASTAAMQAAQQQAMSQLSSVNGQIKSKDDVTVQYQLVPTGQTAAVVQNTLTAKAKSDGEDVLTPLLQQTATSVLTQAAKK